MRIAILGTRGIPAQLWRIRNLRGRAFGHGWPRAGMRSSVYCRERPLRMRSIAACACGICPTIRHKYLDTIAHTFVSTLHLLAHRVDVALYCNGANAIFTALPRLCGMPVALNVDGLERKRKKWNRAAKAWYLVSERLATFLPNEVVTDARAIQNYYRQRYGKRTTFHSVWRGDRQGGIHRGPGGIGSGAGALLPLREPHGAGEPRFGSAAGIRARAHGYEAGADRRCALRAAITSGRCAIRGIRAS